MTDRICITAMIALCGVCVSGANAGFTLFSVSLGGGPSVDGSSITTSSGDFYQDVLGNNYPPSAADIALNPDLADDSYIAIDPFGPSTAMYTARSPDGSEPAGYGPASGHFDTAGELSGQWFSTLGVQAGQPEVFGGANNAVFIGQLTVEPGASIAGMSMVVETTGDTPGTTGTFDFELDGPRVGDLCSISFLYDSTIYGDKYHMYIYEIPAPGGLAAFGALGLVAMRRRR